MSTLTTLERKWAAESKLERAAAQAQKPAIDSAKAELLATFWSNEPAPFRAAFEKFFGVVNSATYDFEKSLDTWLKAITTVAAKNLSSRKLAGAEVDRATKISILEERFGAVLKAFGNIARRRAYQIPYTSQLTALHLLAAVDCSIETVGKAYDSLGFEPKLSPEFQTFDSAKRDLLVTEIAANSLLNSAFQPTPPAQLRTDTQRIAIVREIVRVVAETYGFSTPELVAYTPENRFSWAQFDGNTWQLRFNFRRPPDDSSLLLKETIFSALCFCRDAFKMSVLGVGPQSEQVTPAQDLSKTFPGDVKTLWVGFYFRRHASNLLKTSSLLSGADLPWITEESQRFAERILESVAPRAGAIILRAPPKLPKTLTLA